MAIAGIDAYMHWLIYSRISELRSEGDLPKSMSRLDVPLTDLAALADATLDGRRREVDTRPWVQVKHAMQKRLLKETLQSFDQVATGFAWAGVEKAWSRVATELGCSVDDIRTRLNRIVQRRNQIVHEGDIVRALRPRKLSYNEVDHDSVAADIDWIEELLTAMSDVVAAGNP